MSHSLRRWAGFPAIAMFLIASPATAAAPDARLVEAMARQDKQTVRALMKQDVDVNAHAADGATALQWAAHWDDFEAVDLDLRRPFLHSFFYTGVGRGITDVVVGGKSLDQALPPGAAAGMRYPALGMRTVQTG